MNQNRIRRISAPTLVILMLIASVLSISPNVKAIEAEDFSDTFDDGNLVGWTLNVKSGNTVAISGMPSYSGQYFFSPPYCVHIIKSSTVSGPARATTSYIPLDYDLDYVLQMRFYLTSAAQRGMLIASDGRIYAWITPSIVGLALEIVGGNKVVDLPITQASYYYLKFLVHPQLGTYDVHMRYQGLDWEVKATGVSFRGAPLKTLSIGTDTVVGSKHFGEVYFDNINYIGKMQFFNDDFNDGSIGDWTKKVGTNGFIEVTTAKYVSPSYSLHVRYGASVARATTPIIGGDYMNYDYTIFMWYYPINEKYVLVLDNGHMLIYDMLGKLYSVKSDGYSVQIGSVTYDTWNRIELRAHLGSNPNFESVVNGVSVGFFGLKSNTATSTLTVGSEPSPGRRTSGEAYWDDFKVVIGNNLPDSDGDGFSDQQETQMGTNPNACQKWAVIVCGGYGDALQDDFENDADHLYRVLMRGGYTDDRIYYLTSQDSTNIWRDADGDGDTDVDDIAHLSTIEYAIKTWLHSNADRDDRVFIYFIDHGGESGDSGFLVVNSGEYLFDYQVDPWMDYLETNNDYDRLTCVADCCYSGNWIHGTDTISGTRRIIVTSCPEHQTAAAGFVCRFIGPGIDLGYSVEDSYQIAFNKAQGLYPVPMMNDQCNPSTSPTGEVYIF